MTSGAQAPGPAPRARRALALLGRLRRDRLLDLLRARRRRAARARRSRRSCCSRPASLFLLVSLSYAEGDVRAARDGRRRDVRAARLQRPRRLHDRLGAVPRLPDRDRALGALHAALPRRRRSRSTGSTHNPWDVVAGVGAIPLVAGDPARPPAVALRDRVPRPGARPARRSSCSSCSASSSSSRPHALTHGTSLGTAPSWHVARVRAAARDARVRGPRDGREPGRGGAPAGRRPAALAVRRDRDGRRPCTSRSRSSRSRRSRARRPSSGRRGSARPSSASRPRSATSSPTPLGDVLRFFVGASGALILLAASRRRSRGFSRLAYSLGEHGQLPRAFGRLHRRTLVSPQAIVSAAVISSAIVIATAFIHHEVRFLASVFSFGVLLAFTAAQLAVIKLRIVEPDLPRPYRAPFSVHRRPRRDPAAGGRRLDRSPSRLDRSRWSRTRARATPAPRGSSSASSSSSPSVARTARA